jgi:hypothetical protein
MPLRNEELQSLKDLGIQRDYDSHNYRKRDQTYIPPGGRLVGPGTSHSVKFPRNSKRPKVTYSDDNLLPLTSNTGRRRDPVLSHTKPGKGDRERVRTRTAPPPPTLYDRFGNAYDRIVKAASNMSSGRGYSSPTLQNSRRHRSYGASHHWQLQFTRGDYFVAVTATLLILLPLSAHVHWYPRSSLAQGVLGTYLGWDGRMSTIEVGFRRAWNAWMPETLSLYVPRLVKKESFFSGLRTVSESSFADGTDLIEFFWIALYCLMIAVVYGRYVAVGSDRISHVLGIAATFAVVFWTRQIHLFKFLAVLPNLVCPSPLTLIFHICVSLT